jgi:hypothetical protein
MNIPPNDTCGTRRRFGHSAVPDAQQAWASQMHDAQQAMAAQAQDMANTKYTEYMNANLNLAANMYGCGAASTQSTLSTKPPKRRLWGRMRRRGRRAYWRLRHWRGHAFGFDPGCPLCWLELRPFS